MEQPQQQPAQQPKKITEDLSATVIKVNKIVTAMSEEHALAISEIKACHILIKKQAEKIKTLEANQKEPANEDKTESKPENVKQG